ncbi:TPA: DapH/DapD/GlmU-related protein, partial [Escherichia coli]
KVQNISIKGSLDIDDSSSVNNCDLGDGIKISKRSVVYGSKEHPVRIGNGCYIGMNCCLNGYDSELIIGNNVSIASNVTIITGSGPNASLEMQKIYPIVKESVEIGAHSWIGDNVTILPGVKLGAFCVVAANSVVTKSFDEYSVIGGTPAKLIKMIQHKA